MAKKILIVEDEIDILKTVSFRLSKAGYDVSTASDGQIALKMMEKNKPDLVLLDLRLPVLSGDEVCKYIRSNDLLKNIPIILFTASVTGDIIKKTADFGANDYIAKPFTSEDLMNKIKKFLG